MASQQIFKIDVLLGTTWCAIAMTRVREVDIRFLQRINLFFCYKLGWSHVDARAALQVVYGQDILCPSRTRRWYQAFRSGCTTLVDLQRAHRRKTGCTPANIQAVKAMVDADKSISFAAIMKQTGFKQTTVHRIIRKDLQLTLRSAKLVPAFLTPRHIVQRFEHARKMLTASNRSPSVLKKLVTMDESWCYQYDPETKRQASQWLAAGEQCPSHPRRNISVKKVMLVAFFDYLGMVHFEFIRGGTVDTATFIQILGRFKQALRTKRPQKIWYLYMDNAPTHGSKDTQLHLLMTGQRVIEHPPLSPDLSPCDFWLFSQIKSPLRGTQFQSLDALERAVTAEIGNIPAGDYRHAMLTSWPMRWARCVNANGGYFEGLQ